MTIPEAASLVLKAGGVGAGGVLYLLDMGEPIVIRDLAEQMISFYGYRPGKDIPVVTIGLRPGEKLEEKLWSSDENPQPTEYPGIIKLEKNNRLNGRLRQLLEDLSEICFFNSGSAAKYRNRRNLRLTIRKYIPNLEIPENEPEY